MQSDSVVMAVTKGDAEYLPYSLAWLLPFEGQTVFSVDNASEKELQWLRWYAQRKPHTVIVHKNVELVDNKAWATFLFGTKYATGDRIFWTAPDLVWDAEVFDLLLQLPAEFWCVDADSHFLFGYWKFLAKFSKHYNSQVFPKGFPWFDYTWHSEEKLFSEYKEPVYHLYEWPLIRHLRKTKNPLREYCQGIARRKLGWNFFKILLHAVLYRELGVLFGYLGGMCR